MSTSSKKLHQSANASTLMTDQGPRVTPYVEAKIAPFLSNLQTILNVEDRSIIRWTSNGRAFEIVDMELLAVSVLPRYFRHGKIASFQRQLNYFGFKKWSKNKTTYCTYSHPHFLRDDPDSIILIRRKTTPEYIKYSPVTSRIPQRRMNKENVEKGNCKTKIQDISCSNHHGSSIYSFVKTPRMSFQNELLISANSCAMSIRPDILSPPTTDKSMSSSSSNFTLETRPGDFVEDKDWFDDLDYLTKSTAISPQCKLVDIPFNSVAYSPSLNDEQTQSEIDFFVNFPDSCDGFPYSCPVA